MIDAIEPLVYRLGTVVNGRKLRIDGHKSDVNGLESLVLSRESRVNLREPRMHLGKPAIDQLRMLAKMLFKGFAGHTRDDVNIVVGQKTTS